MGVVVTSAANYLLPASNSLDVPGQPYTLAFWFKMRTNRAARSCIWSSYGEAAGTTRLRLESGTDGSTYGIYSGSATSPTGTTVAFTLGAWYQIALVATASNTLTWYKAAAGSPLVATTHAVTIPAAYAWLFGSDPTGANLINGSYFNIKLWNTALSAADLANEFTGIRPRRAVNLLRWHPILGCGGDFAGSKTSGSATFGFFPDWSTKSLDGLADQSTSPTFDLADPPLPW